MSRFNLILPLIEPPAPTLRPFSSQFPPPAFGWRGGTANLPARAPASAPARRTFRSIRLANTPPPQSPPPPPPRSNPPGFPPDHRPYRQRGLPTPAPRPT